MRGSVIAVSGIDTGTGKTIVTGLLAKALTGRGVRVITQKIVKTGCRGNVADDVLEHRRLMGIGLTEDDREGLTSPYIFTYPGSPHLAASLEKREIDIMTIRRATFRLQQRYSMVLLEGAGGLLVPLDDERLLADYFRDAGYPLLLVSSSRLGSINHTLLSLEACLKRGISLKGLIFNRYRESDRTVGENALDTIRRHLKRYGLSSPVITLDENGFDHDAPELLGLVTRQGNPEN